jgi:hypothetical protein
MAATGIDPINAGLSSKAALSTKSAVMASTAAKGAAAGSIWSGTGWGLGLGLGIGAWGPVGAVLLLGLSAAGVHAYMTGRQHETTPGG